MFDGYYAQKITLILSGGEYFNIHKVYNFPFRYQHEAEFNKMR